jgi:hypothetical protein
MMEPIFAELASETVTAKLRAQIDVALAAPIDGRYTKSRDAAFERLHDWAFTQGFAIVKVSCKTEKSQIVKTYFDCQEGHKN